MLSPIVVAVDASSQNDALRLADCLDPALCRLKVGKELFVSCGPEIVRQLRDRGFEIFLDLKFHDIPNTTAQAVLAAADLGVWMTNVHTACGLETMRLCKARLQAGGYDTLLIGVTVLTSMGAADLKQAGVMDALKDQVARLAGLAKRAQLDGVVCSAHECVDLKARFGEQFLLVTPGIRAENDRKDDQERVRTPKQAIADGADFLVIGRSITQAPDPYQKLQSIIASLA